MESSPRLSLAYLTPQQAQKHVTVNEALRRLDALVSLAVRSRTTDAQPATPAEGDAYIMTAAPSGAAWGAFAPGDVAVFQDGAWTSITPVEGLRAFVIDEAAFLVHDGAWSRVGSQQPVFGVNAAADATNKLAVRSNAVLFDAQDAAEGGTGDTQIKVNKEAAGDTASHLFMTGFSGRAEFGLTGDDDFHLKVSADGAAWKEALVVKPDGKLGFGTNAPAAPMELHIDGGTVDPSFATTADFVIVKEGNAPAFAGMVANSGGAGYRMVFMGARARGTLDAPAAVVNGDLSFSLLGIAYDGAVNRGTAGISFLVDGAVSSGAVPQSIVFETGQTTARAERLRISPAGDVGIGLTAPAVKLDVDGPVRVKSYVKTALPSAAAAAGQIIYVSNEIGGATLAFSDGANWRRVADRAVVA